MILPDIQSLLLTYRTKGLLLDTNLLLLYLVGNAVPQALSTFKPTVNQGFTKNDFDLLSQIASLFSKLITTPHILTEVSNHSDKLKGRLRQQFSDYMVAFIQGLEEESQPSRQLCVRAEFPRFGLTDTAIAAIAPKRFFVLTVDFQLAGHLQKVGVAVLNFNHLRQMTW
jgi:hypothetical protein